MGPLSRQQSRLIGKIMVALAVAAVAGLFLLRGVDLRSLINRGIAILGAGGPWLFFGAMALLPAFGAPLLAFTLTAGPVFAEQMGMPAVVCAGLAALTVNLLLTYWLARRALRPPLERLIARLGYRMPEVDSADSTDLIVVLRVTPGIPFFIQNYLLGLADAPAPRYILISCAVVWPYSGALIVFGDALLHGKGKLIVIAVSLLIAATAATHFLRRHYAVRKAPA